MRAVKTTLMALSLLLFCFYLSSSALPLTTNAIIAKAVAAYTEHDVEALVSLMIGRCPAYLSARELSMSKPLMERLPSFFRRCFCYSPAEEEKIEQEIRRKLGALLRWFPAASLTKADSPYGKLIGKKFIYPDDPEAVVFKYNSVLSLSVCLNCPLKTCQIQYYLLPDGVRYLVFTACRIRGYTWLDGITLLSPYKKDLTLFAY